MSIPGGIDVPRRRARVPRAELAGTPDTLVVVNCAGRTRSIIGAQSLVNAGIPKRVAALRNGTIGWKLAGLTLDRGQSRRFVPVSDERVERARESARAVAARAGVGRADRSMLSSVAGRRQPNAVSLRRADAGGIRRRPSRRLQVCAGRTARAGDRRLRSGSRRPHCAGRRRRRAGEHDGVVAGADGVGGLRARRWPEWRVARRRSRVSRSAASAAAAPRAKAYKRPYEGTDNPASAMQAYLDWEYGLVAQLERDGTHGFRVI